jgi:aspartate/methionine/tyrosine aminotransferase
MPKPLLSESARAIRPGVFADLQAQIDAHLARGGELIPLQIGDTYLDPPQSARYGSIIEMHGADDGLYRYGACPGLPELRKLIAEELRGRRALPGLTAANVHVGVGATHALFCAARSILDAGDDVLLAAPFWPLAPGIVQACGARVIEVPLTSRLYKDPYLNAGDIFRAALTPKTKAIYLITPNNPDGKVLSREHLSSIATFAREHDLWVIADEVYADYTFGPPHISIASLPEMSGRTITAYSFSKSHALAGARVGYIVAHEDVILAAQRVSTHSVFNVPVLMQRAASAALAAGPRWVERASLIYRNSLEASVDALRGAPSVQFSVAEGGAYLFLDFSEVLGDRPLTVLLERAVEKGVLLTPGVAFGKDYAKWARLCFTAVPLPRLLDGIAKLRGVVRSLVG